MIPKSASPTILVVDDFDDVRFMLRQWLRGRGFRVVEATSGQQAVEVARLEHPNLILMDIGMPGGDGLNATLNIRENAETRDVPVVVVSAYGAEHYRDAALQVGCAGFVAKPINFEELENLISRLLPAA